MKTDTIKQRSLWYILIGVTLLGTGPLFVKSVDSNGLMTAFYRLVFAAGLLTIPAFIIKQSATAEKKVSSAWIWAMLGGLSFALNVSLWCTALKYTTASAVTLLDNTAPLWVGVFSWLVLKENKEWKFWMGLLIILGGAAVMIGVDFISGSKEQVTGNWI